MNTVTQFTGGFQFLSNFYPAPIKMKGLIYPTVEHAFQAAKTLDDAEREWVRQCKAPGQAKRMGKKVTLREDWDEIKVEAMYQMVRMKFRIPVLRKLLLNTGEAKLIEGNTWHDNFWGDCKCGNCKNRGRNQLGMILERVRKEAWDTIREAHFDDPEKEPTLHNFQFDAIDTDSEGNYICHKGVSVPEERTRREHSSLTAQERMDNQIFVVMSTYDDEICEEYQSQDEADIAASRFTRAVVIRRYSRTNGLEAEDWTYGISESSPGPTDPLKRPDRSKPHRVRRSALDPQQKPRKDYRWIP
jgi:ribA/ribD-fused uncharacterized protein